MKKSYLIDDGEKSDDEGAHAVYCCYCYVGGGEDAHEDERIVLGGLIENQTKSDE